MARYRSDIPYGYDDLSQVGYWTPETPEFLEKRDERRAAQRASATTYTQAKANIRRISVENRVNSAAPREGGGTIIDFERLERPRRGGSIGLRAESAAGDVRVNAEVSWGAGAPSRAARPAAGRRMPSRAAGGEGGQRLRPAQQGAASRMRRADAASRREAPAGSFALRDDRADYRDYREPYSQEYEEPDARAGGALRGRLSKARHEARHRRADRAFARDYDEPAAPGQEGPRAAVYKGQMGRQHQRAARMQDAARSGGIQMPAFISGIAQALSLDSLVVRPWFTRTAVAALCVVFVAFTVFPDAQAYYLQSRANDQIAAEYQALQERNGQLEQHVEALKTDEGMEELAHESLGWVRDGEHSVSVLADGSAEPAAGYSDADAVVEGSVPTPETWYSPVLDAIFGYEG